MSYLQLFWGFLRVGIFSFGGAYGAIPIIREIVREYNWVSDATFTHLLAISESTPGPIMVNTATYIGNEVGGILGSALATFIVCLPAFIIILLLSILLKNALKNQYVQAVLNGIKPCICGIIIGTGLYMIVTNCISGGLSLTGDLNVIWNSLKGFLQFRAIAITAVLLLVTFVFKKLRKKAISPIMLIGVSACLGIIVYGI